MTSGRAAAEAVLSTPSHAAEEYRSRLPPNTSRSIRSPPRSTPDLSDAHGRLRRSHGFSRAAGRGDALSGGWAVFWNELLNGAPPNRHRSVANAVTHIGRAMTAQVRPPNGSRRHWDEPHGSTGTTSFRQRQRSLARPGRTRNAKRLRNSPRCSSTTQPCPRLFTAPGCPHRSAQSHRTLHHLSVSKRLRCVRRPLGDKSHDTRLPFEVAMDQRSMVPGFHTASAQSGPAHPIRQGPRHDPPQDSASNRESPSSRNSSQGHLKAVNSFASYEGVPDSFRMSAGSRIRAGSQ